MGTITTIKDSRIKLKASKDLIDLLKTHSGFLEQVPENILTFLKKSSVILPRNVESIKNTNFNTTPDINIKNLKDLLNQELLPNSSQNNAEKQSPIKNEEKRPSEDLYLYLTDILWLSKFLAKLREEQVLNVFLNDLVQSCQLELPKNEIIKRNPQLEARCQKLRVEQQNLEYRKMTKNVDAVLKHYPEDTVAYQIKAINSQIIAVLQFIFSVAAGFAFGFLGINLIVGNIEFGLRLLLGIMCALIIALAEIYFLAKKLNEYDNTVDTANRAMEKTLPTTKKIHTD